MTIDEILDREDLGRIKTLAKFFKTQSLADKLEIDYADAQALGREIRKHFKLERPDPRKKRKKREKKEPTPVVPEKPIIIEDESYVYNHNNDQYVFQISGLSDSLVLSGAKIRQITNDYSRQTGRGSTINEIARAHHIPRPAVQQILRALGFTHDSLPWPKEYWQNKDVERLAEEAAELSELDIMKRLQRDKWKATEAAAEKWRKFEDTVVDEVRAWVSENGPTYAPPKLRMIESREPFIVVIGLTDEHWGKLAGTADPYNRRIQRKRFMELLERTVGALSHMGRPEKIIIPLGSDGMDIDNIQHATTKGTPQHTDGGVWEIVRSWTQYKIEQIDLLSQWGDVEVWPLPGNHDRISTYWMAEVMKGWFHKRKDVNVMDEMRPIQGTIFGDTLVCAHHGDLYDPKDLAQIIPKRFAEEWGQSRWRVCFTGHYHTHRDMPQKSDLRIVSWPSPVSSGEWDFRKGYDSNRKSLMSHVVSPTRGVVMTHDEPVL